jgi:hypothetical protein
MARTKSFVWKNGAKRERRRKISCRSWCSDRREKDAFCPGETPGPPNQDKASEKLISSRQVEMMVQGGDDRLE